MNTPNRSVCCTIFLFVVASVSLQAESITTLYNLNFNAPTHTVGQPLAYGPFEPPCNVVQPSPYQEDTQSPLIVVSFGGLSYQPCLFYVDPNQTNLPIRAIKLKMYEDYDSEAQTYPRYKIEMDALVDLFEDDDFWIDFVCGGLSFSGNGIMSDRYTDVAYPVNQVIHIVIDVDFEVNQYTITMDGSPVINGIPTPDIVNEIQISLWCLDLNNSKAAIDNLVVYGIDDQPELHVTKPKLGEGFSVGKTYPIIWYSSSDVQNLTIEYSTDSGSTWDEVSPPNTGNAGVYNWTIPDTPSNFCKLRFTDPVVGIQTESDVFRICLPVPELPPYQAIYLEEVFGDYVYSLSQIQNDLGDLAFPEGNAAWVNGEMVTFHDYWVVDINNQRQILLEDRNRLLSPTVFCIWQNGAITETVTLESGEYPIAINDQGAVLLGYYYNYGDYTASIWINGVRTHLTGLIPEAINNQNDVAGTYYGPQGNMPILWSNGTINILDLPADSDTRDIDFVSINNTGTVAASYSYEFSYVDHQRTFLWKNGERIELEPDELRCVNDLEQYVMQSHWTEIPEPPYLLPGKIQLVQGAEKLDLRQSAGIPLTSDLDGISINNSGWITATGQDTIAYYNYHPLLLVPQRQRTLENLVVIGPEIVYINSTASFRAVGICDDKCPMALTHQSTWHVFPQNAGYIDPNGFLYTGDLDGIDEITVTAEYSNGQTFQASKTFPVHTPRQLYVPTDYPTIQAAVDAADETDEVILEDGIYRGSGNRDIDLSGRRITVKSLNGPEFCIIDAEGTYSKQHAGLICSPDPFKQPTIEGLTITNAYPGIKSPVSVSGAFWPAEFNNCIITNNNSSGFDKAHGILNNCIVSDNAGYGIREGVWEIHNSTLSGNGYGGICSSSSVTVANSKICNNFGSAFYDCDGQVKNSIISGNYAGFSACGLSIVNCTIAGNSLGAEDCDNASFTNCIFYNNNEYAVQSIFCPFPTSDYCLFFGNSNDFFQIRELPEDNTQIEYRNFNGAFEINTLPEANATLDLNPLFVNPGYWDDNGTPDNWDDVWVEGDYHLKSEGWRWGTASEQWTWDDETSPCIDAGNPGMALGDEPTTLDVDPLNRWGENIRINMGAYGGTDEASIAPPGWALLCDLDNSGSVNLSDFVPMANSWLQSGQNLPSDVSRDGTVNLEDFALLAQDWLKTTIWH